MYVFAIMFKNIIFYNVLRKQEYFFICTHFQMKIYLPVNCDNDKEI